MPAFQPFFNPADAIAAVKGPGAKAPEVLITTTFNKSSTILLLKIKDYHEGTKL
jgi:hypothetical protein